MAPDEGYQEARRLLKEKYGQNYKIAAAYVNRISHATPLKAEDGMALWRLSVLPTTCENTLKERDYHNKIENHDSLCKLIDKLPYSLKSKWRDVADDITNNKLREITFDDIVQFVELRARATNHPVFGRLTNENREIELNGNIKQVANTRGKPNFAADS